MASKGRVFSGARPTGHQHLGNYLGAIKNYVALQEDYDCIYCIVDLHALTTLETTQNLRENTYEMALDWLAAGIDPQKTILFIQSNVPEVTELHTILSMVTPMGKLTDLPTFKEKVRENPNNINYGLVGYPVLMSADILLYKANAVPVGVDQAPHIEFAREVVRSFNHRYSTNVLVEPEMKVTEVPKVLGIDGVNKMSKSLGNYVGITEPPEAIFGKMMSISDELMILYYELLSDIGVTELAALKAGMSDGSRHPMEAKIALAREIVARFHGAAAAREAEDGFRGRFSRKEFPDDARHVEFTADGGTSDLATLVSRVSGSFTSKSAARRLIAQGGVEVNGERATDPAVLLASPAEVRLKIGKKEFVVVAIR